MELQQGELFHHLAERFLVLGREVGAAARKLLVGVFQELVLVGVERERVPLRIDGLDPLEERLVEGDVQLVFGHLGGEFLGNLLHLFVGIGFQQVVEDAAYAVQQLAGLLEGFDRIGKGRRLGIGGDRIDIGLRLPDALLEGGEVMLVADLVKGRRAVGERGLGQKRIFHGA